MAEEDRPRRPRPARPQWEEGAPPDARRKQYAPVVSSGGAEWQGGPTQQARRPRVPATGLNAFTLGDIRQAEHLVDGGMSLREYAKRVAHGDQPQTANRQQEDGGGFFFEEAEEISGPRWGAHALRGVRREAPALLPTPPRSVPPTPPAYGASPASATLLGLLSQKNQPASVLGNPPQSVRPQSAQPGQAHPSQNHSAQPGRRVELSDLFATAGNRPSQQQLLSSQQARGLEELIRLSPPPPPPSQPPPPISPAEMQAQQRALMRARMPPPPPPASPPPPVLPSQLPSSSQLLALLQQQKTLLSTPPSSTPPSAGQCQQS